MLPQGRRDHLCSLLLLELIFVQKFAKVYFDYGDAEVLDEAVEVVFPVCFLAFS